MSFEKGSVVIYKDEFWLLYREQNDRYLEKVFVLHGLNGKVVEAHYEDCNVLIEPSEMMI